MNEQKHVCPRCRKEAVWLIVHTPQCFNCCWSGKHFHNDADAVRHIAFVRVLEDVVKERKRQDEKHGGPVEDDKLDGRDFIELITIYNDQARAAGVMGDGPEVRRRLIQVAAIAIAAVESFDRYDETDEKGA